MNCTTKRGCGAFRLQILFVRRHFSTVAFYPAHDANRHGAPAGGKATPKWTQLIVQIHQFKPFRRIVSAPLGMNHIPILHFYAKTPGISFGRIPILRFPAFHIKGLYGGKIPAELLFPKWSYRKQWDWPMALLPTCRSATQRYACIALLRARKIGRWSIPAPANPSQKT